MSSTVGLYNKLKDSNLSKSVFSQLNEDQLDEFKKNAVTEKINTLQEERRNAMQYLQKNYHASLLTHDSQLKLQNRNNILQNVYHNTLGGSKEKLAFLDQKYLDKRRQVQINQYEYSKRKSAIWTQCILFITFVICTVIALLYQSGLLQEETKKYLLV